MSVKHIMSYVLQIELNCIFQTYVRQLSVRAVIYFVRGIQDKTGRNRKTDSQI